MTVYIVRGEWGLKENVCAMSLLAVNSTVERQGRK